MSESIKVEGPKCYGCTSELKPSDMVYSGRRANGEKVFCCCNASCLNKMTLRLLDERLRKENDEVIHD